MALNFQNKTDSLARGTLFGIAADALILPTGLLSTALLTRVLGVESYGLIGVIVAASSPVAWVLASLFGVRSGVKIMADAHDPLAAASSILRFSMVAGGLGALAFALASPLIAHLLNKPEIVPGLLLASLEIFLLPIARTHRDALIATHAYSHSGSAAAMFHIVRLIAVVLLLAAGVRIETVMLAIAIARLAEIWWCRRKLPIPLFRPFDLRRSASFRSIGPEFLNSLCVRIYGSLDILLLSVLSVSVIGLSHYTAAQTLALLPGMLSAILVPGLISKLSLYDREGDRDAASNLLHNTFTLVSAACALLLASAGASRTILTIMFGQAFADGEVVLRFLLAGGAAAMFGAIASALLIHAHRSWTAFWCIAPLLPFGLAAWLFLIPVFGEEGAAAVQAAGLVVSTLLLFTFLPEKRRVALTIALPAIMSGTAGFLIAWTLSRQNVFVFDLLAGLAATCAGLVLSGTVRFSIVKRFIQNVMP
jgi:O-antigen/teichoic acid export membrane protein